MPKAIRDMIDADLLCIGSGPAGQRAAVQAAKLGKRVVIIEKRRVVGGVCLDTGTIPSKTFREAVLAFGRQAEQFRKRHGFAVPSRPGVDQLFARVNEVVEREGEVVQRQLERNDITVVRGEASFIDAHTVQVFAEEALQWVQAEHVVVAVGTVPAPPLGMKDEHPQIITSDKVMGLERLPRSMVVVGAGVIGLEYASMFGSLGVDVTLVDSRQRPLEFLDNEIVDELIHQMRNYGVTFRLGETVEQMECSEGKPTKAVIYLESGKKLVSDLVLYAVGRIGATETLELQRAGLEADERGRLKVNERFQTTVPHIFAAGDVIGYPSLAATSSEQGRLAACHAFGMKAEPMTSNFPIGIYAVPEISMVGENEQNLTIKKVPYEMGMARYREIARGHIMGDDSGLLKLLFHRKNRQLLGVHAIGFGATELVHIGQAVLGLGGGLEYFMSTVFNYPTMAECYKVASLDAFNKLSQ
ncbi:MAG: Si-specific NAD(P)(+) transhydrogenase [Nitrospira sp.]|nr:Si-specific NAD(P)(+) transhydrogenase [Nitrospira sp.]MCY4132802.1 Si-specific NAD(P)(+) transhydrogenase [Nitrospira sp.]